jgi:NAD(P)-dependent dehydrogenase (short-subunit alcohol dehydrogenase family)
LRSLDRPRGASTSTQDRTLQGQEALVTSAASGIGRANALRLAGDGGEAIGLSIVESPGWADFAAADPGTRISGTAFSIFGATVSFAAEDFAARQHDAARA